MTDWRTLANYHLPSDVPANLDYATVADATLLVHDLAQAPWPTRPCAGDSHQPRELDARRSPAPRLPLPGGSPAGRGCARRSASSAFSRVTAYAGTPLWRARVAISKVDAAGERALLEPRVADHDRPRAAHARVEVQRVEQLRARVAHRRLACDGSGQTSGSGRPAVLETARDRARRRGGRQAGPERSARDQQPLRDPGAARAPPGGRASPVPCAAQVGSLSIDARRHDRASFQQWPPRKRSPSSSRCAGTRCG